VEHEQVPQLSGLTIDGVSASYGRVQVIHDISVHVPSGERLALLGTNGAGKSTLLKLAVGLLQPTAGAITIDGVDVTRASTRRRLDLGLYLMMGGRTGFPSLSVRDNLTIAAYSAIKRRHKDVIHSRLDETLSHFPTLTGLLDKKVGLLSGGERQLVGLGGAIMAKPKYLLVDEVSMGLSPQALQAVFDALLLLSSQGLTLVMVEQSLTFASSLSEKCCFLEKGRVTFAGNTAELYNRRDVARAVFFGSGRSGSRGVDSTTSPTQPQRPASGSPTISQG
jgi:branched-chain amino acid transport system ATP-binding protein